MTGEDFDELLDELPVRLRNQILSHGEKVPEDEHEQVSKSLATSINAACWAVLIFFGLIAFGLLLIPLSLILVVL